MVKTFIHLDAETISADLKNRICTAAHSHSSMTQVDGDIHLLQFDDTIFSHVLMLLGQNPNRYGYNLSTYIPQVSFFFKTVRQNGLLSLGEGTSDARRKLSEDLGVAISSLFMVRSFNLEWTTINQIPQYKNLNKFRPDFLGYNPSDERFVYEAKGTTRPETVEDKISKALEQAKSYTDEAVTKFAVASYFPSSNRQIPPFTFIADPSIGDVAPPSRPNSTLLHYVLVLAYAGLDRTRESYLTLLSDKFKAERDSDSPLESSLDSDKLREVDESYVADTESTDTIESNGQTFVGRWISLSYSGIEVSIFLGVERGTIERVIQLNTDISPFEEVVDRGDNYRESILPDGSIYRIEEGIQK